MPGVPSIYYGSEFGIEGKRTRDSDYDLRPCLDLNNVPNADLRLCEHIARLGRVRLGLEALKYGKFENVNIMNEKLVYKRFTDSQTVFVAFNLTDREERIGFDSRCSAKLTDVLGDNEIFEVNGWCELPMRPYSARILVVNDGSFRIEAAAPAKPVEPVKTEPKEIVRGRYRHFKGNEYEVIGFARHSETEERLVLYRSLKNPDEVWARPYEMFRETVWHNGHQVKRFERIDLQG